MRPIIIAHGGVGSRNSFSDGPRKASEEALKVLKKTSSVLKAAIRGTVILEDDPRFNAGTGSRLRMDGKTIEMDASIMDSNGNFGAVACISNVKNPVLVAELVSQSPHLILCGEGATKFARLHNVPVYNPITPQTIARFKRVKSDLRRKKAPLWAQKWVKKPFSSLGIFKDTIGIVVSDGCGNFAAANSTGGTSYMLRGRVGDSPLIGCGIYVGKKGAVVTTGVGEEIIRTILAKEVYEQINNGMNPQKACDWGLTLFNKQKIHSHKRIPIGIVAVNRTDFGIAATHQMAVGLTHYKK